MIKRIACFTALMWGAAALLYIGQHSVAMIATTGVLVLAGLDLCQPEAVGRLRKKLHHPKDD